MTEARDRWSWLRTASWLDVGRVRAWARCLVVVEVLVFIYMAAVAFGLVPYNGEYYDGHFSPDWVSFYAAGELTAQGHPALVYDRAAHYAAEQDLLGFSDFTYNFFFYPPIFLLVWGVFAHLSYHTAWIVWLGSTLGLMTAVLYKITGRARLVAPFLAFPPVFLTATSGQNGFLSASLFGLGTLLLDRRPYLAGLALGALCYKPHFGILVPIALIAGREWRAGAGAATSVLVLILASWLCFGTETWAAWIATFSASPQAFETGRVRFDGSISTYGAVRLIGGDDLTGKIVQILAFAAAAAAVAWVWWRRFSLPLRAMVLVTATVLAVPVILFYDLVLLAVVFAWFVEDAWRRGFLPWDRVALLGLYGGTMVTLPVAHRFHVPAGQLVLLGLAFLVFRRLRAEATGRLSRAYAAGPV